MLGKILAFHLLRNSKRKFMIHKFLVQIEYSEKTRWQGGNHDFMMKVLRQVKGVASAMTEGEIPECSIILEESPNKDALYFSAYASWFCNKCRRKWFCRGMHPDCDGEEADMIQINNASLH
jgi:hypothetical protein